MQAATQMINLYKLLIDKDVTMLEINPLVETEDGQGKSLFLGIIHMYMYHLALV